MVNVFTFRSRRGTQELKTPLRAWWEADGDPISDDFTPEEIDAANLFKLWVERNRPTWKDDLVPIHWFVDGDMQIEYYPHAYDHAPEVTAEHGRENFLTFYTTPADVRTGRPVNWMALPVVDKGWRKGRDDKGGFIQEATGWKPSVLQPFVHLDGLLAVLKSSEVM